jgi:hypothetical protein
MPKDETEPTSLAELIELALRKRGARSSTELQRIAAAAGLEVTHTTLNKIRTGKDKSTPTPKTIEALAYLSGVPLERVKRLVGTAGDMRPFAERLPPAIDVLLMEEQEALLLVMRKMVRARLDLVDLADRATAALATRPDQSREGLSGTAWLAASDEDRLGTDEGRTGDEPG